MCMYVDVILISRVTHNVTPNQVHAVVPERGGAQVQGARQHGACVPSFDIPIAIPHHTSNGRLIPPPLPST